MMEITERANKYADGKANEAITTAIAQAYMDGYRDGYKDREEEIPVDLRDKKTEYVDLGLPSGTLWSTDYEKDENGDNLYLPYEEASNLKLPTPGQWQELDKECMAIPIRDQKTNKFIGFECVGPNGKTIRFDITGNYLGSKQQESEDICAWMKSTGEQNCAIFKGQGNPLKVYMNMWKYFTGNRLIVRLVR